MRSVFDVEIRIYFFHQENFAQVAGKLHRQSADITATLRRHYTRIMDIIR
jgi:hypothetical protein